MEFGAFAIVVNEFATQGISGARPTVLLGSFVLIAFSDLLPTVLDSIQNYVWNIQFDDLERYFQVLKMNKMNDLDIGTIEQPEFQNMLDTVNSRGTGAFFSIINILTNTVRNIISLIIASISLYVISPVVLIVVFVGALPTYFFEKQNAMRTAKIWKDNTEKRRMWQAKSGPVYGKSSLIELKNFGLVKIFLKKFITAITSFHQESKQLRKKILLNDVLARLCLTIAYGAAFGLIILGVYQGAILIGSLVFAFSVISRFQWSINTLFDAAGRISEHQEHVSVFIDLLEMQPLVISGVREITPETFEVLEFRDVSFSYPGNTHRVTQHMNLRINKGDNIAIVGLNGAGKTTFLKLLTRVYDPSEGEILVNGINLKEYQLDAWKKCMGILFQDYSTYSEETIAENIMLGDVSKHDQSLVKASALETTADDYINELPDKYDQKVGTEFRGGVELSKGQKQKLVLARVFYRNPAILILDEPTAAIDALSEDAIFKTLRNKHHNQTRIIISHKFSNVRESDKIILIEHGKIIEEGSHENLMELPQGRYRELFNLQAEGYK
jgi:ABC-type multidrug transport system fused ATPase/permease subunit